MSKDVVSQQRSIDVPVTREEVTIDRHPVDRRQSDGPIVDAVQEAERVSDTVRREELVADSAGDVDADEPGQHNSRAA